MKFPLVLQALGLTFGIAKAAPSLTPEDSISTSLEERASSCNTATNRACWSYGFDLYTDYETSTPETGVTRTYDFIISEHENYVGGDGKVKELAMLINSPIVEADWGDWIEINVFNNLTTNGTSMHWHGIRMHNNNMNDGANGITECPIPPGHSKTYRFRAEQYGTTWYHSHFSAQYANGVTGSIVIHGPASLPYDIDLGVFPISDWYYQSADHIAHSLIQPPGAAPPSDNILFNGSHVNADGGGSYYKVRLTPGKRHLVRLINPSVDNTFTVTLANHDFTIIGTDLVPVNSFTTREIFMNVGQRYDVVIDATKPVGNYWFNATLSSTGLCGASKIISVGKKKPAAIFSYAGASDALPTNPGTAPQEFRCHDSVDFRPVVRRTPPRTDLTFVPEVNSIDVVLTNHVWEGVTRVYWDVHGHDMNITWDEPTLEYIAKGNALPARYNVFEVPQSNTWSFWVIENTSPLPHPMHLHGHDFLVLGRSPAPESPFSAPVRRFTANDISSLEINNPTRRDVTVLPAKGWLAVAFRSDNPGAWLFHCHIAWHVSAGLSVQFLERAAEIPNVMDLGAIEPTCGAWTEYYATSVYKQSDSGL